MKFQTSLQQPIEATKALIKFCEEQDYKTGFLDSIITCSQALEAGDGENAVRHFKTVPFGGMGCFNDWLPTKRDKYDWIWGTNDKKTMKQFEDLTRNWIVAMRSLEQSKESK